MLFRIAVIFILIITSHKAFSQCAAAPVGTATDPVLQMKLNGDGKAGYGPSNVFTSTEEGAIVWDDSNNAIAYCNGSTWVNISHNFPSCTQGQSVEMSGGSWTCVDAPDPKNYVFVTSTTYNGNLGGISGANAKCQSAADSAGLSGTYKSWISTDTGVDDPPTVHSRSSQPYYLVDGTTKVADNWNDFVDSNIDNAINRDENGNTATGNVWTNIKGNGEHDSNDHCNEWTTADNGENGRYGIAGNTNLSWTKSADLECDNTYRLYCFKQ